MCTKTFARLAKRLTLVGLCALILTSGGCSQESTRPIVKIGVAAPFEGLYRSMGYEALYAVKIAVDLRNQEGGVSGYMVELVALNDDNDPSEAVLTARTMIVDPYVLGVIGHLSDRATLAALDRYHRAASLRSAIRDVQSQAPFRVCCTRQHIHTTASLLELL